MAEPESREAEKPQPEQSSPTRSTTLERAHEAQQSSKVQQSIQAANWILDVGLFLAVLVAGVFVCKLLWDGLISQQGVYRNAIDLANTHHKDDLIINYARALDFATVKLSALLLGFILAFLGALYVLRSETSTFRASVKMREAAGAIQTSSPGLVMLTLGVLAVVCTLFSKSYLSNEYSEGGRVISATTNASELPAGLATTADHDGRNTHVSQLKTATGTEAGAKKYDLTKFLRVDGAQDVLLLPDCKEGKLTQESLALLGQEIERLKGNPSQSLVINVQVASGSAEMAQTEGDMCASAAKSYVVPRLNDNPSRVKVVSQGKERPFVR